MSDTLVPVKRARVLVPTKNDVLETRKEAIQNLDRLRVETSRLASLGTKIIVVRLCVRLCVRPSVTGGQRKRFDP